MTETEAQGPRCSPSARHRTGRLLVALLAVTTAAIVALSLSTSGAAAQSDVSIGVHHEPDSRGHHDEAFGVHHEPDSRGHHDEAFGVHHEPDSRGHHDEAFGVHHEPDAKHHGEDCEHGDAHWGGKLWRLGISDTLTDVLGIDAETLRTKLSAGSTLADIAAEQGVEVSAVVDVIVKVISDHAADHGHEIDTDVWTERITAWVNGERPERPEGEDGRRGPRGLHRGGTDGQRHWVGQADLDTAA